MTAEAHIARQVAVNFEAKKHELRQLQDGHWKITLTIHPNDMPDEMMKAAMGTRYMIAAVEIGDDEAPVVKESRKWEDLKPSQQAGIRCNEQAFSRFLMESYGPREFIDEDPALFVRDYCSIESRSELDSDEDARAAWSLLEHNFQVWRNTPEL